MHFCQFCGRLLARLVEGWCGGKGAIYGCPTCDKLFEQTTGGIVPTPGGETLSPVRGSYRDYRDKMVHCYFCNKDFAPKENNNTCPDCGVVYTIH